MLVLLVLFPIVMIELRFLGPLTSGLRPALGTFIGNATSVALLTWPLMPLTIRGLNWWLLAAEERARWINPIGAVLLAVAYIAEIVALGHWLS
jgi:antibiotic biosynthesis monooxygenase (ABM) superfamily enzyme